MFPLRLVFKPVLMSRCLHPFPSLSLLFLILSGFIASAQENTCKPVLKANRHKVLKLGDASIEGTEYRSGDITYLSDYLTSNRRRIQVKSSNRLISEFYMEGAEISGNVYREYDLSGKIKLTDSLDQKKGRHTKSYLGYFSSSHVVSSTRHYPNGNPESSTYYNLRKGEDSIIKTWYSNRFPKSIRIKNYWQSDSVVTKWDSTGILRERTNSAGTELYYPNGILMLKVLPYSKWSYSTDGILENVSHDTMIAGKTCEQKKTFYASGILKSVEYYSNGEPCYAWTFYTPEGLFKNTVKKGLPTSLEIGVGMVATEYAPEFFTCVEESPSYPGGEQAFRKEMEKRLADLLCQSETEVTGTYKLRYLVNESGEVLVRGLEGANADKLTGSFVALFSGMPKWRPGKQNGRVMSVRFALNLSVKEN